MASRYGVGSAFRRVEGSHPAASPPGFSAAPGRGGTQDRPGAGSKSGVRPCSHRIERCVRRRRASGRQVAVRCSSLRISLGSDGVSVVEWPGDSDGEQHAGCHSRCEKVTAWASSFGRSRSASLSVNEFAPMRPRCLVATRDRVACCAHEPAEEVAADYAETRVAFARTAARGRKSRAAAGSRTHLPTRAAPRVHFPDIARRAERRLVRLPATMRALGPMVTRCGSRR